MNVKEIALEWLKEHGYDGLYNEHRNCGCCQDDFMDCDWQEGFCEPAYKIPSNDPDFDYLMTTEKPKTKP